MNLLLDPEQLLLQSNIRTLMKNECPTEVVRTAEATGRMPAPLWALLRDSGWLALGVKSSSGGAGGTLVEWTLFLEEAGAVACPLPLVEHGAVAIALGDGTARERPPFSQIGSGAACATVGLSSQQSPFRVAPDGRVSGGGNVPFAEDADVIVVAASSESGPRPALLEAANDGLELTRVSTLSGQPTSRLKASLAAALTGDAAEWEQLLSTFLLGRDAYALGLTRRMLDMTVEYAQNRVQFGRPIGTFQAIQHRCADMALLVYSLRNVLYRAAWSIETGHRGQVEAAALAHALSKKAAGQVAAGAHQVHGAMGFTAEYPLQLFSRRAKSHEVLHGTASSHLAELSTRLGSVGSSV